MIPGDAPVEAIELGIDADEQEIGVAAGRIITWDRTLICVFALEDGSNAVGFAVARSLRPFDLDWARLYARRRAVAATRQRMRRAKT